MGISDIPVTPDSRPINKPPPPSDSIKIPSNVPLILSDPASRNEVISKVRMAGLRNKGATSALSRCSRFFVEA
jgi:hypothetical protein